MPRTDAPGRVPPTNHLLAALPTSECDRLLPFLDPVSLVFKAVLYEPGQPLTHVYFPLGGVLSLIHPAVDGGVSIEVGLVGREGMVGLPMFLGAATYAFRCLVQVPGEALRMRADHFRAQVGRDCHLHGLLLRYTHAFLMQVSQSVVCNSLHTIEKRLCRWLLAVHARVGDRFPLTHEFLAAMLGVRRASVSVAARALQKAGLIHYRNGELTVLHLPNLTETACGCHSLTQAEYDRLQSPPPD